MKHQVKCDVVKAVSITLAVLLIMGCATTERELTQAYISRDKALSAALQRMTADHAIEVIRAYLERYTIPQKRQALGERVEKITVTATGMSYTVVTPAHTGDRSYGGPPGAGYVFVQRNYHYDAQTLVKSVSWADVKSVELRSFNGRGQSRITYLALWGERRYPRQDVYNTLDKLDIQAPYHADRMSQQEQEDLVAAVLILCPRALSR